jgi:predicted enzyme related to lactoylglutathione lyase
MKNMSGPLKYWMFSTNNEQTVGGGLMKRQQLQQTIINYLDLSSLGEYAKKVEGLGSRIKVPKNRGCSARLDSLEHRHQKTIGLMDPKGDHWLIF